MDERIHRWDDFIDERIHRRLMNFWMNEFMSEWIMIIIIEFSMGASIMKLLLKNSL